MRKVRLFYLLIASATVLASCTKPTDTPPGGSSIAVTLNPTIATLSAGDSVSISCTITDQNTLKDVVISEVIGSGSSSQLESYTLSGKSYQFNYTYHVPSVTSGTQIVLTFTVDDASNTQTATTTITVGAASDFNAYSAVLLGSYADATAGSFYGSSTNTVYTVNTANSNQSAVDMVFFYGSTNQYTLAAPSDGSFGTNSNQISSLGIQNWTTKNITNFKFTNLTDFTSITKAADIANAYNNASGSSDTKANMLSQGDIFAFQTAANKYGLCKVVDETGGNTSGQGEMHIQVVVQK